MEWLDHTILGDGVAYDVDLLAVNHTEVVEDGVEGRDGDEFQIWILFPIWILSYGMVPVWDPDWDPRSMNERIDLSLIWAFILDARHVREDVGPPGKIPLMAFFRLYRSSMLGRSRSHLNSVAMYGFT